MYNTSFTIFFSKFLTQNSFSFEIDKNTTFLVNGLKIKYLERILNEEPPCEFMILVWFDQWQNYPEIVMSRLVSALGLNSKLPARVCKVRRIDQTLAIDFLNKNHLQQSSGAKIKLGLFLPKVYFRLLEDVSNLPDAELLVAVMTFSGSKKFYLEDNIVQSYELIRFSNLVGLNVVGGFSKMLKYFVNEKKPGNIMTYVDADWSDGTNFVKLGFELKEKMSPIFFKLDEYNKRVKIDDQMGADVVNSGSYKYIMSEFS